MRICLKFLNMDIETQNLASLQQLDVATTILGRQMSGDLSWEVGCTVKLDEG